jgi:hypothetical protein
MPAEARFFKEGLGVCLRRGPGRPLSAPDVPGESEVLPKDVGVIAEPIFKVGSEGRNLAKALIRV